MEREPKLSPELQELERLVIEGVSSAIKTGRIPQDYGETLITTYKEAVRRSNNPQDTEEAPGG